MKKTILVSALVVTVVGAVITSCKSSSEKVADAENNVQVAKMDLRAVQRDSMIAVQKVANVEEWKIFRNESQVKIKNNEIRIDALKSKMKIAGQTYNTEFKMRIDSLEMRNKELVIRMDNYDRGKNDWETFKLEFNRDVDRLGVSLTKFTVKNNGK